MNLILSLLARDVSRVVAFIGALETRLSALAEKEVAKADLLRQEAETLLGRVTDRNLTKVDRAMAVITFIEGLFHKLPQAANAISLFFDRLQTAGWRLVLRVEDGFDRLIERHSAKLDGAVDKAEARAATLLDAAETAIKNADIAKALGATVNAVTSPKA